ncbi:hypothetical protein A5875_000568, partial [Enterococcus sp. 3H8_DIV0648]
IQIKTVLLAVFHKQVSIGLCFLYAINKSSFRIY